MIKIWGPMLKQGGVFGNSLLWTSVKRCHILDHVLAAWHEAERAFEVAVHVLQLRHSAHVGGRGGNLLHSSRCRRHGREVPPHRYLFKSVRDKILYQYKLACKEI